MHTRHVEFFTCPNYSIRIPNFLSLSPTLVQVIYFSCAPLVSPTSKSCLFQCVLSTFIALSNLLFKWKIQIFTKDLTWLSLRCTSCIFYSSHITLLIFLNIFLEHSHQICISFVPFFRHYAFLKLAVCFLYFPRQQIILRFLFDLSPTLAVPL